MKKVLKWLANNPLGGGIKIGISASLTWALENIGSFNFNPLTSAIIIAAITVAINALNPQDPRYGVKKQHV